MSVLRLVPSVLLAAQLGFAQGADKPAFDVAAIRPSAAQSQDTVTAGARIDGAQVRFAYMTLKDYLGTAYRVRLYQISGPDWIASDRWDISATVPAGASISQIPEMLQSLLEERFQLKMHREKKDLPVYALEVARDGPKLQESTPDPNTAKEDAPLTATGSGSAQGVSVNLGRGSSYSFANGRFEAKRLTMPVLAVNLERFLDRPIVDTTGLTGSYDFSVNVTPEDYRNMLIRAGVNAGAVLPPEVLKLLDSGTPVSLFDGLQKLGLRLNARRAPLDMVVVDAGRKTPTDN